MSTFCGKSLEGTAVSKTGLMSAGVDQREHKQAACLAPLVPGKPKGYNHPLQNTKYIICKSNISSQISYIWTGLVSCLSKRSKQVLVQLPSYRGVSGNTEENNHLFESM